MAMTRFVLFMLLGWYLVPHILAGKRGTSGTPHRNPNQQNLPMQRGTSSHGDAGQDASSSSGATNSRRAQSSGAQGTGNATTHPDLPWMVDKHAWTTRSLPMGLCSTDAARCRNPATIHY
ncbi:unnamed protein product [Symbiodinium natans]|uniref:Secreted protein n=1 Tax=Symbiodinium natans TaxID=878477 RepID=A0A812H875_9DINO|nr:unnamed protein product [Symbiodinium natans]